MIFTILVPEPGDAIVAGAKVAVTPVGAPVMDNVTADFNAAFAVDASL